MEEKTTILWNQIKKKTNKLNIKKIDLMIHYIFVIMGIIYVLFLGIITILILVYCTVILDNIIINAILSIMLLFISDSCMIGVTLQFMY